MRDGRRNTERADGFSEIGAERKNDAKQLMESELVDAVKLLMIKMADAVKSTQRKLIAVMNLVQCEREDATKLSTISDLAWPLESEATDATKVVRNEQMDMETLMQGEPKCRDPGHRLTFLHIFSQRNTQANTTRPHHVHTTVPAAASTQKVALCHHVTLDMMAHWWVPVRTLGTPMPCGRRPCVSQKQHSTSQTNKMVSNCSARQYQGVSHSTSSPHVTYHATFSRALEQPV